MRLLELQQVLNEIAPHLNPPRDNESAADRNAAYRFKDLGNYRAAVVRAASVPALKAAANAVLAHTIMRDSRDELLVPVGEANAFVGDIATLAFTVGVLGETLRHVLVPESEESLAIRLPDTHDLKEIADAIADVTEFLSGFVGLPIGDDEERFEPMTIESFDVGSMWLVVKAKGWVALKFVARVLRGSLVLLDWAEQKQAEAKLLSDVAEDNESAMRLNRKLRTRLARDIATTAAKGASPKATEEEIGRVVVLLDRGERLLERRVSMVASLKAPAAVRSAFPTKDAQELAGRLVGSAVERLLPTGDGTTDG